MVKIDVSQYGLTNVDNIIYNPSYETLFQAEMDARNEGYEKGVLTNTGAVCVNTGIFTGRSPKDKYFVKDKTTADTIWWGNVNKPVSEDVWKDLKSLSQKQLSNKKNLYVVDAFCGTNVNTRLKVRFIMEVAWQAHFVKNMFIRPSQYELENFGEPDFVVLTASKTTNPHWKEQNLKFRYICCFQLNGKDVSYRRHLVWWGIEKRFIFDYELFSSVKRHRCYALFG
jgi:phosphoenolpyruvate carboxykinase (ATP)